MLKIAMVFCVGVAGVVSDIALAAPAIPEILVTGHRLVPSINEPAYATAVLNRSEIEVSAGDRLDDVLRSVPGFNLFRRQSSRAAHPTTQGVTLRGIGPSGAGRTLVLLDGVPQNDPFGGWVDWGRMPVVSFGRALLTRGGGAGPWGNMAMAGVIRLETQERGIKGGNGSFNVGPHDTLEGTVRFQGSSSKFAWDAMAHGHSTDGSFLIRADQRGPIDRRASDQGGMIEAGLRYMPSDDTSMRFVGRISDSRFINGVDIAKSGTRISDAAISIVHTGTADAGWQINAYARDQSFSAMFASVNAARTLSSPSLDQFSVPAKAFGGGALVRQSFGDHLTLDVGADVRYVEGETNEKYQYQSGVFMRLRRAGGEQVIGGAFTEINCRDESSWLVTLGARADLWRQADGLRQESVLATGQLTRDERFPNRSASVGSLRAAVRYAPADKIHLRGAVYNGFRLPTLNELYRPFRVGNDITEANSALGMERLEGLEIGFDWSPTEVITLTTTYFRATLKDAVTNVTVQSVPGFNAGLNVTVPSGGVLRQRLNIDRITANGIEASLDAVVSPDWRFALSYLFTSPYVSQSPQQPSLEGLRLAQTSRHQATLRVDRHVSPRTILAFQVRGASNSFDDDQNARVLRGYVVADVTASYEFAEHARLVLSVENIFDRLIEAGRSADGLVSVGTPRTVRLGYRTDL